MTSIQPGSRKLSEDATLVREYDGSLYLVTRGILMVDIERSSGWQPVVGGFAAILTAPSQRARQNDPASAERFEQTLSKHGLGARIYAIRQGIRIIVTSRHFDPASGETEALVNELYPGSAYAAACRESGGFRVALTPDLARLGPAPFQEEALLEWLFLAPYSAAQYLRAAGRRDFSSEVQHAVDAHDRYTQALSRKPLLLEGMLV